jgi:hypothetical protein
LKDNFLEYSQGLKNLNITLSATAHLSSLASIRALTALCISSTIEGFLFHPASSKDPFNILSQFSRHLILNLYLKYLLNYESIEDREELFRVSVERKVLIIVHNRFSKLISSSIGSM